MAYPDGITGRTRKTSNNGCGGCHGSSSNTAVVVTMSGPATLQPGETGNYTLTVTHDTSGNNGGCNIAASSGSLAPVSTFLKKDNNSGELTQTNKVSIPSTYEFTYTAPNSAGQVTLYGIAKGRGFNDWNWSDDFTITVAGSQSPPAVTTQAATSVGQNGATLNGQVNPNGASTTYYFDYGTSAAYGSSTTQTSAGSGTTAQAVSAVISGLTPGTTYHYRLVASNSAGTTNGNDMTFTTAAQPPPTVTTQAATGIGQDGATLNGQVNPNGSATTYHFEYGLTTSYGSATTQTSAGSGGTTQTASAVVGGLSADTTYHFRLVASNAGGTSHGSDLTFTTSGTPAPRAMTDGVTGVTMTGATLQGRVDPNGEATDYYFEYGPTTGYGMTTATMAAGSGFTAVAVTADISGLDPETVYHFRLVASSGGGTDIGADASFSTTGEPTGDVDGNGQTDITDVVLVGMILVGNLAEGDPPAVAAFNADFNQSGYLEQDDIQVLMAILLETFVQ
jgi:hypothetical protein